MNKRAVLVISLTALFFSQCKSKKSSGEAVKPVAVIGVSMLSLQNEFVVNLKDELLRKAKNENIKLIITDAQHSAEKQIQQVESFISQGVDAIILNPCEVEACSPAIEKAHAAKIPVVNVNSETASLPDAFVGSRDEEAAQIAMEYIAKSANNTAKIAMMEGYIGQAAQIKRSAGAKQALSKYPGMQLLTVQTGEWDRAKAMNLMENWIQVYGSSINAVFAQNDEMAMGALQAIEQAGMKEKIKVVGIDAIGDALNAVKEGRLNATVYQDAREQGEQAIEMAMKLVRKEPIKERNVYIPFRLVTRENVDEFLKK